MLEYVKKLKITCSNSGGSPYPRMDGRKIANLLQEGYRMPKPQHLDDKLYVNMVLLLLVFGFSCLFVCFFFRWLLSYMLFVLLLFGCMCTSRFTIFTCLTSLTKGNESWSTLSPVYNCGKYLFSFVIRDEICNQKS